MFDIGIIFATLMVSITVAISFGVLIFSESDSEALLELRFLANFLASIFIAE